MTTTVALPATIESMGAAVLVPHLARRGFDNVVVALTTLSCTARKRANACAFKHHRHVNARAFVLGQGQRDDGADCVVVGNSGARGNVHHGRCGADEAKGNTDDIIC